MMRLQEVALTLHARGQIDLLPAVEGLHAALERAQFGSVVAAAAIAHFPAIRDMVEQAADEEKRRQVERLLAQYGPVNVLAANSFLHWARNQRRLRAGNIMRRKLARLKAI